MWLTLGILGVGSPIYSQLNDDDYAAQMILVQQAEQPESSQTPFSVSAKFDIVGDAKFEHERCKRHLHNIQFAVAQANASMIFHYTECYKEGLLITGGYQYTRIKWDNPFFSQDNFNTVSIGLGGFSERIPDWSLQGQVQVNADLDDFELSSYLSYNVVLAGRYAYNECVGIHLGLIILTGMKIDRVYPIIGFDWQINEQWKLNMVYPLNIALIYAWDHEWSFGIAGRAFEERHREGDQGKFKRGLVEYRAAGVEAGVYFKSCNSSLQANLHVGESLGGKVKVSDQHHKHSHRYRFGAAPYVGGDIAYRF